MKRFMEKSSPGDVYGLVEIHQQLQRPVNTTHGDQISCPLFQIEESLQW